MKKDAFNENDVLELALAARIGLKQGEAGDILDDLAKWLEMAEIMAASTNGAAAAMQERPESGAPVSILREDAPTIYMGKDKLIEQSPSDDGGFSIPRLLE